MYENYENETPAPEPQKTKTASFRLKEETADKFKAFLDSIPGTREDAFIDLMDTYELHHSKSLVPDREKEIALFQSHANSMMAAYTNSLEICANAEERIKAKYERDLKSKDETIADLQEKLRVQKEVASDAQNKLAEADKNRKIAEADAAKAIKDAIAAEEKAKDKESLAELFSGKLKTAEEQLKDYPELKSKFEVITKELEEAYRVNDVNMVQAKYDQERAVTAIRMEMDKALAEKDQIIAARELSAEKALASLEKEKNAETQKLRDKIDALKDERADLKEENAKLKVEIERLKPKTI